MKCILINEENIILYWKGLGLGVRVGVYGVGVGGVGVGLVVNNNI